MVSAVEIGRPGGGGGAGLGKMTSFVLDLLKRKCLQHM